MKQILPGALLSSYPFSGQLLSPVNYNSDRFTNSPSSVNPVRGHHHCSEQRQVRPWGLTAVCPFCKPAEHRLKAMSTLQKVQGQGQAPSVTAQGLMNIQEPLLSSSWNLTLQVGHEAGQKRAKGTQNESFFTCPPPGSEAVPPSFPSLAIFVDPDLIVSLK